jgi:hypothetical protein
MLRIGRNSREGVSLGGIGETTGTISPTMSGVGTIDTKAFLFAACFFGVGERAARFTGIEGIGRIGLRDKVCRSRI